MGVVEDAQILNFGCIASAHLTGAYGQVRLAQSSAINKHSDYTYARVSC